MTTTQDTIDQQTIEAELERLAEIGAGLIDGDEVKQVITPRSLHYVTRPDPEHRFLAADYYDVEHAPFLRLKKLLMRIERLARGCTVDGAIWMQVPETDHVTLVLHNGPSHRYYRFSSLSMDPPAEMRRVLTDGVIERAPLQEGVRVLAALAPIRDSLQDIVGCVELASKLDPLDLDWS